jgi:hypothetical protein
MVAGTRALPSNCASFREARMAAAISKTRFLPSSIEFGIWKPAGNGVYHFRFLFATWNSDDAQGEWGL